MNLRSVKDCLEWQEEHICQYLDDIRRPLERDGVRAIDIMEVTSKTLKIEKCLRTLRNTEKELMELVGSRYY